MVGEEYWLAHCISADFVLGAGIAVEFANRFNERNVLKDKYGSNYYRDFEQFGSYCLVDEFAKVFNLVTKKNCYDKPTYYSMEGALDNLFEEVERLEVKHLAMPLIGCGIDGLKWDKVSSMIQRIFYPTKLDILVCIKPGD